jgi:hypothetical protein
MKRLWLVVVAALFALTPAVALAQQTMSATLAGSGKTMEEQKAGSMGMKMEDKKMEGEGMKMEEKK